MTSRSKESNLGATLGDVANFRLQQSISSGRDPLEQERPHRQQRMVETINIPGLSGQGGQYPRQTKSASSEYRYNQQVSLSKDSSSHQQQFNHALNNPMVYQTEEEKALFKTLSQGALDDLRIFLAQVSLDLTQIWDPQGYTALHLAGYKNSLAMVQLLCQYVLHEEQQKQEMAKVSGSLFTLSPRQKLAMWINQAAQGEESFTIMHFAAFNGNIDMLEFLRQMGADLTIIHRQSKSQLTLLHVAAMGDQPGALAYLRRWIGVDEGVNQRDIRLATPLHWACYSGAENAAQYLLAWKADANAQDHSGITPLHQAVKSAEEIKSARIVRMLLIKGALRSIRDACGRKSIDIARECKVPQVKKELIQYLEDPNFLQKLMIQTPLQKTQRSLMSVYIYIFLFTLSIIFLIRFTFQDPKISFSFKVFLSIVIVVSTIFFLLSWLTDPGYLIKSPTIDFIAIVPRFQDPNALCPECELIKTKRCRHCNVCGRCVERFDHHCPWINNCVGYRNHAYFYVYIVSLQIYITSIFGMLAYQLSERFQPYMTLQRLRTVDFWTSFNQALTEGGGTNYVDAYTLNLSSLGLLVLCLIFIIPLLILVCVQTRNMFTNETTSERFSRTKKDQNGSHSSSNQEQTNQDIHQQHKAQQQQRGSQSNTSLQAVMQRKIKDDEVNFCYVNQLSRNCLQMSCAIDPEFESQEELLDRKLKHQTA